MALKTLLFLRVSLPSLSDSKIDWGGYRVLASSLMDALLAVFFCFPVFTFSVGISYLLIDFFSRLYSNGMIESLRFGVTSSSTFLNGEGEATAACAA